MNKREKIDVTRNGKEFLQLHEMKELERKKKKKLKKVLIFNGYVMTNNTNKWKHLEIMPDKNGNTSISDKRPTSSRKESS